MKVFCFSLSLVLFFVFLSVYAASPAGTERKTIDQTISPESSSVRCHQFPKYFIIEKDGENNMGTDILVKYKSVPKENYPCEYLINSGDFEIKNEWVEYYSGVKGDLLLLDSTTGPGPTPITIWDLKKREKVYVGSWADSVFHDNSVLYWEETGEATIENCPELEMWKSYGMGGVIETKVILNLADFTITKTTETRCSRRN